MRNIKEVLTCHIREQIAMEEHLSATIDHQIEEIDDADFEDAKNLLIEVKHTLEKQFKPLNSLLDELEEYPRSDLEAWNGSGRNFPLVTKITQISRILRDDYSVLNLITISNTALHAAALAVESDRVASVSLTHLKNLAPIVVKIGELIPEAITREIKALSPSVDLKIAKTALKNTKDAWHHDGSHAQKIK